GSNQIAVGAQRLAQRGNLGLKIVLLDDPVRPDSAHQQLLVDDRAAGVDQGEQRVKGAAAQRDGLAVGEKLSAMRHDLEAAELQDRERLALAVHRRPLYRALSGVFRAIQERATPTPAHAASSKRFRPRQGVLSLGCVPWPLRGIAASTTRRPRNEDPEGARGWSGAE